MKTTFLLIAALVIGAIGGLGGDYLGGMLQPSQSSGQDEIRAKSFVLVNDAGNIRGKWEALANGSTILTLFDERGKPRGEFLVLKDGRPSVALVDDKGTTKGVFGMTLEGKPVMNLEADKESGGRVPK